MIVVLRHAPQGSQVVLRSLLAYTPLGGWASQSEEELEGESRREGEKGWSSLSLSSKLGTTCHFLGDLGCSKHAQSSGLEICLSVLLWLHHFHTPIHFLIMIPFQ